MGANIYDINTWEVPENKPTQSLEVSKVEHTFNLRALFSLLWITKLDPSVIVEDLEARRKIIAALRNSNTDILEKLTPEQTWWDAELKKAA